MARMPLRFCPVATPSLLHTTASCHGPRLPLYGGNAGEGGGGGTDSLRALGGSEELSAFQKAYETVDGEFAEVPTNVTNPLTAPPEDETPPPNSGTVIGAVALITGSTVGAGILALPQVIAPAGVLPSSAVLVACWTLLLCEVGSLSPNPSVQSEWGVVGLPGVRVRVGRVGVRGLEVRFRI